jgi:hypothetical protein
VVPVREGVSGLELFKKGWRYVVNFETLMRALQELVEE